MPTPFAGLVVVAEFGSKFEADVAASALNDAGIPATTSYDPAINSVAPYLASDRVIDVLVGEEQLVAAREVLDQRADAVPYAFTDDGIGDWPRRRGHASRLGRVVVLVAIVGPFVVGAVVLLMASVR
jgi:hypothetical protein